MQVSSRFDQKLSSNFNVIKMFKISNAISGRLKPDFYRFNYKIRQISSKTFKCNIEKEITINSDLDLEKKLIANELSLINKNISRILASGNPLLNSLSSHYFQSEGKYIRPQIVLLISKATQFDQNHNNIDFNIDEPLSNNFKSGNEREVDNYSFHCKELPSVNIDSSILNTQRKH